MDANRFDQLTRHLAAPRSRRRLVRAAIGGAVTALVGGRHLRTASAQSAGECTGAPDETVCMDLAREISPCAGGYCVPYEYDENGFPVAGNCEYYENWGASCGPGVPPCVADICDCPPDGCVGPVCVQVAVNNGASCDVGGPCAGGGICSDGACVGDPAPLCKSGRINDGPCDCDGACCAEGNNCVGKPGARHCQEM
jgi:hypothetical protein